MKNLRVRSNEESKSKKGQVWREGIHLVLRDKLTPNQFLEGMTSMEPYGEAGICFMNGMMFFLPWCPKQRRQQQVLWGGPQYIY